MTSKGIDAYIYLSGARQSATIHARNHKGRKFAGDAAPDAGRMQSHSFELSRGDIKIWEKSGQLKLEGSVDGKSVFQRFAEINPVTGNIADTDLGDMLNTRSVVKRDYAINYGFADAGKGKRHQAWIYMTDSQANWMGRAIDKFGLMDRSFGTFVLPGSHDAGMFTGVASNSEAGSLMRSLVTAKMDNKLSKAGALATWLLSVRVAAEAGFLAAEKLGTVRKILIGLTYTQKDTIATQLALGTRYFDFRPGYNVPSYRKDKVLRMQHNFAPGSTFESFLSDIVKFLSRHKREIVVAQIKFDGFADAGAMTPPAKEIDKHLKDALAGTGIVQGGIGDLDRKVGDLLTESRRFIVLRDHDKPADSYSDKAYATDNPKDVVAALDETLDAPRRNAKWTVLQLQGTYTNKIKAEWWTGPSLASMSDASSPLLSTKAKFDHKIYPWLMRKDTRFAERAGPKLVVLLNDFVDNALSDHAFALTGQRAARPARR